MTRTQGLAIGLILTLLAACPALAQTSSGPQASVTVKDLDLNSRQGATTFLKRLDVAVARVCGSDPGIRDLERLDVFETCKARARTEAIDHLNNAEVSAVAAGAPQEASTSAARPKI